MKWTVVLTEEAERDINAAAVWYEGEASGLGRRFLDAVGVALAHIEDNPQQFPVVHRDKLRALPQPAVATRPSKAAGRWERLAKNGQWAILFVALHVNLDKTPWLRRETFTAQAALFSRC